MEKAIVLLSGGLDSATTLYYAKEKGYACHCLIFDYGQRHDKEIRLAQSLAKKNHCPHQTVKFRLPWKGSALVDKTISLPENRVNIPDEIPVTYVPGRNIIFLSFAASFAESIGAETIFIGANFVDYSGYPDCRPEFYRAYNQAILTGLKAGVEGKKIQVKTPLIKMSKADIIRLGTRLNVPYHLTWSCYKGGKNPCGKCDSCLLRAKGFEEAGRREPLLATTVFGNKKKTVSKKRK
jgi:7-cyano-7-deazaguanine synthase